MPQQGADYGLLRLADRRIFIQTDGPNPRNGWDYYGCMSFDDIEQGQGDVEPVYCPDPYKRNSWIIVDEIQGQQELASTSFTIQAQRDARDAILDLKDRRCNFHIAIVNGRCQRPDDRMQWDSMHILRNGRITSFTMSGANPLSGEDNAEGTYTGDLSLWDFYPIRALLFGEKAESTVLAEIIDGFYYDVVQCGECGPASDGCDKQYWLAAANAGSPGLSAQVVYTLDGGGTYATRDVVGLLSGASAMIGMGEYLVVFTTATPGHRYILVSDVNDNTGSFGTVTTGYVEEPRAAWVKSAGEAYVVGDGGYIYRMTSPTRSVTVLSDGSVTTQNLAAVHGYGSVIVAVGALNAVAVSKNSGRSFSSVVGPSVGDNLTTVWAMSENIWLVGNDDGELWFTDNQGKTWTEIELDGDVTSINDIKFYDDVVGYLAVNAGGAGRIYRTVSGGYDWQYKKPSLDGLPDNDRINVVAVCGPNEVSAGGLAADGTDGLIVQAS